MGCTSSKQVDVVDVYRPASTSVAVFDINTIKEPWLAVEEQEDEKSQPDKPIAHLPAPILEKLDNNEEAPRSWDEVSKELEDLKPTLNSPGPAKQVPTSPDDTSSPIESPAPAKKVKRRSFSFHTLEELENKTKAANKPAPGLKKTESSNDLTKFGARLKRTDPGTKSNSQTGSFPPPVPEGYKSLKENPFLLRDKLEREQQGLPPLFIKRDPLEDYPEICPPGGADKVVIYSTSLGGVRRTYEDCNRVRSIMELHGFVYEERDISLHGEFRTQLRELLVDKVSDSVSVPRMFVKGRYIGGVDEIVGLNETGRLRRILSRVGIEKQVGRQACEGCGGARFVPCLECGGSCKVVVADKKEKERCPECNENGLMYCPMCS
ncbi:Glutaredoxin [Artemisia annua]|uniref:Glutaredoxin n=1 Tax=Artemisia annua TaxID=35608 RepID=A0A2U1MTM4_ARTAN|nr:Glutaredoxin [Artemisia annua]